MNSRIPKPAFGKLPTMSLPANAPLPLTRDLLNMPSMVQFVGKRPGSPELLRATASATVNRAKLRRSRSATDLSRPDFHRPKFVPTLDSIRARPNLTSSTVALMVNSNLVRTVGKPTAHLRRSRSASEIAVKSNFGPSTSSGGAAVGLSTAASGTATLKRPLPTARPVIASKTQRLAPPVKPAQPVPFKAPALKATAVAKAGAAPRTVRCESNSSTTSSNSSKSSSAGAVGKAMNKRIPPYDYKARFQNLQEKHKMLQEKYEKLLQQNASQATLQEMYDECSAELEDLKQQHAEIQRELLLTKQENESLTTANATLAATLKSTEEELKLFREKFTTADRENAKLKTQLAELSERASFLEAENATLVEDNQRKAELLFNANIERKDLHNAVMDLRGNIRVFCRVRPPLASELDRLECLWKYLDEQTLEILATDGSNKRLEFSFDHIFHPRTLQADIFENVSPLIQSALDGFNVCIFAYGQTGSGKTYTMDGVPENLGVIPRTVDLIFDAVQDYKRLGWEYEIRVTFLEIYNEVLYDLLDTSGTTKELEIRMANAKNKTEVYVSNIIEETVESKGKLRQLMNVAKMNRATAATVGNERSSRSHAVTKIMLIGSHQEKGEQCVGTVNLVDLAGSESPKTSMRMDETKNINRSLSELSNVILALMQKHEHIPYRNSKLTHLLMPSLGGNSKTLMFVNVAPFQDCYTETLKSLRFASQVNSCKLQKVRKNKMLNNSNAV